MKKLFQSGLILSLMGILSLAYFTNPVFAQQPLVLRTQKIIDFQQIVGKPNWIPGTKQRILGAVWQFNPDGTFFYAPANSRDDLYPITGRFQRQGKTLMFSGDRTSIIGTTGNAFAQVEGKVDFSSGQPVLFMRVNSGMGSKATINRQSFSMDSTSSYSASVILWQQ